MNVTLLDRLLAFFPIRKDPGLPDIDIDVWRLTTRKFQFQVTPQGPSKVDNMFLEAVAIWIVGKEQTLHCIRHEPRKWIPAKGPSQRILLPEELVPSRLVDSAVPRVGSERCTDVRWIALISRRNWPADWITGFSGRLPTSRVPPKVGHRAKFFVDHCKQAFVPTALWFLALSMLVLWVVKSMSDD